MGSFLKMSAPVLALGLLTAAPPAAVAQVETQPNCHWVSMAERGPDMELWCRGDDGRARPTGRMLQQQTYRPAPSTECPRGQMYDGVRCRKEREVISAAPQALFLYQGVTPPPPPKAGGRRPRVWVYQDANGEHRRGLACIDERDATICQPIPRD